MNVKIYHNPRCSKSRQALHLLEDRFSKIQIIKYLDERLSVAELISLVNKLNISPIELVRKNEKIWKDLFKGKPLTDQQVIEAMQQYPKLIERPIVLIEDQSLIARPIEKLTVLIEKIAKD